MGGVYPGRTALGKGGSSWEIRLAEGPILCDRRSASTACGIATGAPVRPHRERAAALPVRRKESLLRATFGPARKRSTLPPYRKKSGNQREYSSRRQTIRPIEHAAPRHLPPPCPLARCMTQLPSSKSPQRR